MGQPVASARMAPRADRRRPRQAKRRCCAGAQWLLPASAVNLTGAKVVCHL